MSTSPKTIVLSLLRILLCGLALTACTNTTVVGTPAPLPTGVSFTPLADIQGAAGRRISTLVYMLPEEQGASLHDVISFEQGQPRALTPPEQSIWCDNRCASQIASSAATVVLARGVLDGPGTYGPQRSYRWQLKEAQLGVQAAEETTLEAMLNHSSYYERRLLRVRGIILLSSNSALLLDQLGPGGMPNAATKQVKLRWPYPDQQLIDHLKTVPERDIRSGQVQVEGYLLNGALVALSVRRVE